MVSGVVPPARLLVLVFSSHEWTAAKNFSRRRTESSARQPEEPYLKAVYVVWAPYIALVGRAALLHGLQRGSTNC